MPFAEAQVAVPCDFRKKHYVVLTCGNDGAKSHPMSRNDILQIRLSHSEKLAWEEDARRRDMTLSQWVRSGCATYLTCGRRTVTVPAGDPEPEYVEELRAEIAEVKRLQAELKNLHAEAK